MADLEFQNMHCVREVPCPETPPCTSVHRELTGHAQIWVAGDSALVARLAEVMYPVLEAMQAEGLFEPTGGDG